MKTEQAVTITVQLLLDFTLRIAAGAQQILLRIFERVADQRHSGLIHFQLPSRFVVGSRRSQFGQTSRFLLQRLQPGFQRMNAIALLLDRWFLRRRIIWRLA